MFFAASRAAEHKLKGFLLTYRQQLLESPSRFKYFCTFNSTFFGSKLEENFGFIFKRYVTLATYVGRICRYRKLNNAY